MPGLGELGGFDACSVHYLMLRGKAWHFLGLSCLYRVGVLRGGVGWGGGCASFAESDAARKPKNMELRLIDPMIWATPLTLMLRPERATRYSCAICPQPLQPWQIGGVNKEGCHCYCSCIDLLHELRATRRFYNVTCVYDGRLLRCPDQSAKCFKVRTCAAGHGT